MSLNQYMKFRPGEYGSAQLLVHCTGSVVGAGMALISCMVFCHIYQGRSDYIVLNDRVVASK